MLIYFFHTGTYNTVQKRHIRHSNNNERQASVKDSWLVAHILPVDSPCWPMVKKTDIYLWWNRTRVHRKIQRKIKKTN